MYYNVFTYMQFNAIVHVSQKISPVICFQIKYFQVFQTFLHQMIYMLIDDGHIRRCIEFDLHQFFIGHMFDIDAMRINLYKKFISPKKGESNQLKLYNLM